MRVTTSGSLWGRWEEQTANAPSFPDLTLGSAEPVELALGQQQRRDDVRTDVGELQGVLQMPRQTEVCFGHPSETLRLGAEAFEESGQWTVTKATMSRSARRLMEGVVFVPATH